MFHCFQVLCGVVIATLVETTTSTTFASKNCTLGQGVLFCEGIIPATVSSTVNKVLLDQISPKEFHRGRFCQVSWSNVTELFITSIASTTVFFDFTDGVFDCLSQIRIFELSSRVLRHYTAHTFNGLSNVTHFSLVDCKTIHWKDLHQLLVLPRNLPKLAHLSLSGSGIYDEELNLDQDLVNSLSQRSIISLDFSRTSLLYNFSSAKKLCKSLTSLSDAGAQSEKSELFMKNKACQSLKVLDNSDSQYLRDRFHNVRCVNAETGLFFTAHFFESLQSVYIDKFATEDVHFRMRNCSFFLFNGTMVEEVHSSHNYFYDLDAELMNDKLEILNFSNNEIQTINRNALRNLSSLRELDLSHNKLEEAQISELFIHNMELRILHLSSNSLQNISYETFETNVNLKELWMVKNRFQQIHFNITHLVNLAVLDLRHNDIKTLDTTSQTLLETLYLNQIRRYDPSNDTFTNQSVEIRLQGNPFSCDCYALAFVQWFATSPIFATSKETYQCQIRGHDYQMGERAVDAARQDCARIQREKLTMLLSVTLCPFCASLIVSAVIIIHKRRKKKLLDQRFASGIQRLRQNGTMFPVFLSYSSDDSPIVKHHMLNSFQVSHDHQKHLRIKLSKNIMKRDKFGFTGIETSTHLSLVSLLWDDGKQNSPRCDTAKCGVPSVAILFAYTIFIEK